MFAFSNALIPSVKPLVLILCTGNSCRSQMAEAYLRRCAGELLRVESAGPSPSGFVHPLAIRALSEDDIDVSDHRSKHLDEFLESEVETVITVCGDADAVCPTFPGQVRHHHWPFEDPALASGDEEQVFAFFRSVRDSIARVFTAYGQGRLDEVCLSKNSTPA